VCCLLVLNLKEGGRGREGGRDAEKIFSLRKGRERERQRVVVIGKGRIRHHLLLVVYFNRIHHTKALRRPSVSFGKRLCVCCSDATLSVLYISCTLAHHAVS